MADYYPKLDLAALIGFPSLAIGNLFTNEARQTQGAAGLRWLPFDFGRVDAEVAVARGAPGEAPANWRQAVLGLKTPTSSSFQFKTHIPQELAVGDRGAIGSDVSLVSRGQRQIYGTLTLDHDAVFLENAQVEGLYRLDRLIRIEVPGLGAEHANAAGGNRADRIQDPELLRMREVHDETGCERRQTRARLALPRRGLSRSGQSAQWRAA